MRAFSVKPIVSGYGIPGRETRQHAPRVSAHDRRRRRALLRTKVLGDVELHELAVAGEPAECAAKHGKHVVACHQRFFAGDAKDEALRGA